MVGPLVLLLIAVTLLMLMAGIIWPGIGVLERWRKARRQHIQIMIEDALKHLYNSEYKKVPSTLESVAGALSISGDEAAGLISKLELMKLLQQRGPELELLPEGRSYALRIIRTHRLWERYLADETTVQESEWHARAEKQEHLMSAEEANDLASRLGHPAYDPHGDPIPTAGGVLPKPRGKPLTSLKKGEIAGIVHVEDEPGAIYEQLVAQGLGPGMRVHIIDQSPERVVFEAGGNEVILAPVFAANITAVPLGVRGAEKESFTTLAALKPGEGAVVTGISSSCRGVQRRRLMDLGVVPGTRIEAEMQSVAGDPVAYRIRGSAIALRKEQADHIYIEYVEEPNG